MSLREQTRLGSATPGGAPRGTSRQGCAGQSKGPSGRFDQECPWFFDTDGDVSGVVFGNVELPGGIVRGLGAKTDAGAPIKIPVEYRRQAVKDLVEAARATWRRP